MLKTVMSLAVTAACVVAIPSAHAQFATEQVITHGPIASPGDFGDWDARRNIIESRHYEWLVKTNPSFRAARMRRECGPISDPQLNADCLASFDRYEPFVDSSMAVGSGTAPGPYLTAPGAGY